MWLAGTDDKFIVKSWAAKQHAECSTYVVTVAGCAVQQSLHNALNLQQLMAHMFHCIRKRCHRSQVETLVGWTF